MNFQSKFIYFHSRRCIENIVRKLADILSRPQSVKIAGSLTPTKPYVRLSLIWIYRFANLNSREFRKYTCWYSCYWQFRSLTAKTLYGPLTRYVKLRVAHAPGMSGMFSPPPTSKETTN